MTLGSIYWPAGSIPVSVLRDRSLEEPAPGLTLTAGDRVCLLAPALPGPAARLSRAEAGSMPGANGNGRTVLPARRDPGPPPSGQP